MTVWRSGYPVPIQYTGTDTLGLGGGNITNRPNLVAPVTYPKKRLGWFSTSSFANPVGPWVSGTNQGSGVNFGQGFGNAGKDAVVGPGLVNFNWSLYKTIAFREGGLPSLELRFEFFNVFNHTQFGGTSNDGLDKNSADANFGQVTSAYDARTLQLGAKFHF